MTVQKYDIPVGDGEVVTRYWSPVNAPVLDAEGRVAAIIHHVEDVTGYVQARLEATEQSDASQRLEVEVLATAARLRRADQALLESEARFRNVADNAPVMMWVTDPGGSCTYLNRRWYEFTGQTPQEAEGYGWLDVTHPEDRGAADETFRGANAHHTPFRLEYRLRRADGVYRWAIDAASPRFDESGEFLGYVGSVIDIDERREMEDRLRVKEERLRLATEFAEIGFWDLDLLHDTLLWPPRVRKMFGISSDEPVTMADFYDGLHPEDRDRTAAAYAAAVDPTVRGLYDVEYRTVGRDDGVVRWVAAKGRGLFDEAGRCVRVVGTATDVTDRKIAEQHLLLMVHELNHRVKNTLATVQAIIAQTTRGADVPLAVRASKVTPEIATTRGVPLGADCVSPSRHSAFSTPLELLHFIAELRTLSGGKPVGFKLCVGLPWEFMGIAKAMLATGVTPDFIVVDGAEGGTGAAPTEFSDHIGTPMREGLLFVHNVLVGTGLRDKIRIGAAGKIVSAFDIASVLAIGADWANAARGFMFALGCVQSVSCDTNRCPTGIATQDRGRQAALVVPDKAERVHNFHRQTLRALADMLAAAGLSHPDELGPQNLVRRVSATEIKQFDQLHTFLKDGDLLGGSGSGTFYTTSWRRASADHF